MHLLLVEDDLDLGAALRRSLSRHGYACTWVRSAKDAWNQADQNANLFACVILDLGLPDGDGLDLLRQWRNAQQALPIIILTAQDALAARVSGLDAGADDYIIKPAAIEELVSRIRAVTRRSIGQASLVWEIGGLQVDVGKREVRMNDEAIALSPREFQIIEELARHAGDVVPKHRIAQVLHPFGEPLEFSTLDWHIHNLRRKLGANTIHTVRGVGYSLGER